MHIFLGTLALLGVGMIGLLLEIHKQDKQTIATLAANQKPVPWNKGKKYKLPPRVQKVQVAPNGHDMTMVLNTEVNGIISAWDKDGNQTVAPVWEPLG